MTEINRYAKDWNEYSKQWEQNFGPKYKYLGDEWNDDGTAERLRDDFYRHAYISRWVQPHMTVLEVGPGGGKWITILAPLVKKLIVLDVSEEMLSRTRSRCAALGLTNIEYVLGDGSDFQLIPDASIDFFFSYDVFVHIALEDTFPYTQEMARVLIPGGRGVCHYAVNSTSFGWNRIEQHNQYYRGGRNTLGQFYYFSPEALVQMYLHCGLQIFEQHLENYLFTIVFAKPANSIASKLETLLRQLISPTSDDLQTRTELITALKALPQELEQSLIPLLEAAHEEDNVWQRVYFAEMIRQLWRGI